MKNNFKKYLPVISVLLLTGCGIWTDFTTFFNLYFNTRELYYEAQEQIEQLPKEPFELDEPTVTAGIKTMLTTLQEKTSKILQHESESSYFDDALFISGWAFYFNSDYIKASRKFQELASLGNEDYNLKSQLWIGKCDLQMRNFDEGMDLLTEVRDSAIAREDEDVLSEVYRVIISYHIDREQYETAISEGENFINISDDDELNAKVAFQIGLLYLESGADQEAANAFESVLEYSPDFETEFYSRFELAKLLKELGNLEESLEMLDDLYNEGKYAPFWGDVYYEIGLIEYEAENYERAFNIFTDVNELYASSTGALQSQLMLGEIMRNVYANYDSAKVYYDKVKGNNVDPELREKAEVYSESITTYLNIKSDLFMSDRQITYINNPTEFIRDSLAYQRYLVKSGAVKNDLNIVDTTQVDTTNVSPSDSTTLADSTTFISSRDSLLAQSTIDVSSFNDEYLLEVQPVYPKVGIDSLESRIAKNYFELGNLFFTDLIRPDSAYYYYSTLLDEFPETQFKPRVLFALGTYYETKGDSVKSDSLYLEVYNDFKTHPIANEAARKLGKPLLRTESDPAQLEYLSAEAKLDSTKYLKAVEAFKEIAANYPESIYKPKSLYTVGWIYENKTDQPDSAFTYYSQIVADYKNSEYAAAVQRKVSAYKQEMEKIEKENEVTSDQMFETVGATDSTGMAMDSTNIPMDNTIMPMDSAGIQMDTTITNTNPQISEPEITDTTKADTTKIKTN